MISAKVIADSYNPDHGGNRLTTLQLCYPRLIHSEVMTHRAFSRNASSSRAIPVAKVLAQVRENPAMPVHWGVNKPGMQASAEVDHIERKFYFDNPQEIVGKTISYKSFKKGVKTLPRFPTFKNIRSAEDIG